MQIIENQYFGCFTLYKILCKYSNIKISSFERYQKNSFRNRCNIIGANGMITLSVPVVGGRNTKATFMDVKVADDEHWRRKHFRAIETCYAKSPYFDYYIHLVEKCIFFSSPFLWEINFNIVTEFCKCLKIPVPLVQQVKFADELALFDTTFFDAIKPQNFQSSAFAHMSYYQLFSDRIGFQQNVSILDLLFNEGPNAKNILQSSI